jgi:hypothetical protein
MKTYFIIYNDLRGNSAYTVYISGYFSSAKRIIESDNKLNPAIILPQN